MYILTPEKLKPWGLGAAIENAISNAETKTVDNFIVSKNIECVELYVNKWQYVNGYK